MSSFDPVPLQGNPPERPGRPSRGPDRRPTTPNVPGGRPDQPQIDPAAAAPTPDGNPGWPPGYGGSGRPGRPGRYNPGALYPRPYFPIGFGYYSDPWYCRQRIWYQLGFNSFYTDWYTSGDLYGTSGFLAGLSGASGYAVQTSLDRYAYGDTVLSDEILDAALEKPHAAALILAEEVSQLRAMIEDFRTGLIDRTRLAELVAYKVEIIRRQAALIEDDAALEYLDQNLDRSVDRHYPAASVPEFEALVLEIEDLSQILVARVDALRQDEDLRTVDLVTLQAPSFRYLARQIDELAGVIEESIPVL